MDPLEIFAVVTSAACTWLLAKNKPLGWWIGLVGVTAYAVVFYRVRLFAEVGIQVVYFVTSLQAIWIWLHGGRQKKERPIGRLTLRWALITLVVAALATWGLYELLVALRGAVPFWDALTAVMSLVAHAYLMFRIVENWWVWIAVDVIYIPLYASRGLYLTSVLYFAFLIMSIYGLINFLRIYREQQALRAEERSTA
jgi:nicotinamide mononucleotide transporter